MNIMNRVLRLAFALALAGAIAMQIPSRGGVAIADDTYGGSGGGGARTLIQATVFALVGYGIYATATGQAAPLPPDPGAPVGPGGDTTGQKNTGAATGPGDPIWDVTNKTDDLKTFATVSEKAGLKDKLKAPGHMTAFVPTNTAFSALDQQVLQDLMKDENKAKLADIIGFHVVDTKMTLDQMKADVAKAGTDGLKMTSLTGKSLTLTNDGGLKINGVPVVEREIPATNGVIYAIQSVLMPMEQ